MKAEVTHPIFILAFLLLGLIAIVHSVALSNFLYWEYPWLDSLIHFLGGSVVALFTLWVIQRFFGESHSIWSSFSLYVVLIAILIVGSLWEVFEYTSGIPRGVNFRFDTALDFLMDILGAVAATFAIRLWR